ncbi:sigma-70 RNA polymerase sigma factor region 4 domain-containing protein [Paenibacillus pini]|uniref:RNA polymerase sigma factor 70 region 4 type 2 domain-containing protein n=1 Tax=Paenibacillus pini JCM 16418 TaxID=1236976 RepID=W7Z528_9BACL|nr:sigma-70 family RNA polymerase sigma factor [Paenibacillus pini]GAF09434.1 hypothetical protein JCM16418_3575 [Paenibacillus pini JCM 16418]
MGAIDYYKRELNRIAWRIQDRVKRQHRREITLPIEIKAAVPSFAETSDNRMLVQHLFEKLPDHLGKKIIYDIYIHGKKEIEIACELQISQQAVNRWKRKTILQLRQMLLL